MKALETFMQCGFNRKSDALNPRLQLWEKGGKHLNPPDLPPASIFRASLVLNPDALASEDAALDYHAGIRVGTLPNNHHTGRVKESSQRSGQTKIFGRKGFMSYGAFLNSYLPDRDYCTTNFSVTAVPESSDKR